ncbi:MAG: TIGR01244 family sulfur transferase [Halioglobus sp.]
MKIVKLSASVSVSEQITPGDVPVIAAAGFKVIINNRPDGEVADQPTSDEVAAAARSAGLAYFHIPITAADYPGQELELMASLLDNPEEPVLAFCRTGTRSTNLWLTTRASDARDEAVMHARSLGYDLAMSSQKN